MVKFKETWREKLGSTAQRQGLPRLKAEGHEVEMDRAGKPKRVKGWEGKLVGV
jgi:hypothetical protein